MQMRYYTSNAVICTTEMAFDVEGTTYVEFDAKNTNNNNVKVQYSTDGGATWTGDETFTVSTQAKTYTYTISEEGVKARVKFSIVVPASPTNKSRLYIDNVKVYGVSNR